MWRWLLVGTLALAAWGCAAARVPRDLKRDVSALVNLDGDAILVRESIQFEHGSAEIDPRSTDLLDAVAEILRSTTAIRLLTVEGHTDTTGDPEANQPLSLARATAVLRYLEGKGIDPSRLEARGFGSTRPLDSNDTEDGRAKNRRVEFKVSR